MKAAIVTLVAALLLALYFILLLQPFRHPNTRFAYFTGAEYPAQGVPAIDFAFEDYLSLTPLSNTIRQDGSEFGPLKFRYLDKPDDLVDVGDMFGPATSQTDVAMVYVTAHALSLQGRGYLLCGEFTSSEAENNLYPVDRLLSQIGDTEAAVKLVIIDGGRLESDPRLGVLVNEFPRLLSRDVAATKDRSLWVLSSHSELERSHVSRALQRSVFGFALSRGLKGAADGNADQIVDIGELHRYVRTQVAEWVQQSSAGAAEQTPELFWGGGPLPTTANSYPGLVAVSAIPSEDREEDVASAIEAAQSDDPSKRRRSFLTGYLASSRVGKRLSDTLFVAKQTINEKRGKAQARGLLSEDQAADKKAAGGDKAEPSSGDAGGASGDKPDDDKQQDKQGADAKKPEGEQGGAEGQGGSGAAETNSPSEGGADQSAEVEGAAKGSPQDESQERDGAQPEGAEGAEGAEETVSRTELASLLNAGWRLRDELATRTLERASPIDYAPHRWRQLQRNLLYAEQRFRAGSVTDPEKLKALLEEQLTTLQGFVDPSLPATGQTGLAAERRQLNRLRTLGLAEQTARASGLPLDDDMRLLVLWLDRVIAAETPADFDQWMQKQWKPSYARFHEMRLARQLYEQGELAWPVMRMALRARRLGEQTAAFPFADTLTNRRRMLTADRVRMEGERRLQDRIGAEWQTLAYQELSAAVQQYRDIMDDLAFLQQAVELKNDLFNDLPYYLHWRAIARGHAAPQYDDLSAILERLPQLCDMLDQDGVALMQVRPLYDELLRRRRIVRAGLDPALIDRLIADDEYHGAAWRVEVLLATPLLSAEQRLRLLESEAAIDARWAVNFASPQVEETVSDKKPITDEDWLGPQQQLELQMRLADLAGKSGSPAWQQLRTAYEAFPRVPADGETPPADSTLAEREQDRWLAIRESGAALKDFYEDLPRVVTRSLRSGGDARVRLHAAERGLRLLDARDRIDAGAGSLPQLVRSAQRYEKLLWNRDRFLAARADTTAAESRYLAELADSHAALAKELAPQEQISPTLPPPLSLDGTTAVSLTSTAQGEAKVTLRYLGDQPLNAWIVLHYDDKLLSVAARPDTRILRLHELVPKLAEQERESRRQRLEQSGPSERPAGAVATTESEDRSQPALYPYRPDQARLPHTRVLNPGDELSWNLTIRRETDAAVRTKVVFKTITAIGYLRHEIDVALPSRDTLRLAITDGVFDTWANTPRGLLLKTFANRPTEYRMSVVNDSPTAKTISGQVYAPNRDFPSIPNGELSGGDAARAREMLAGLSPLFSFAELSAPGEGKTVHLPFPIPPKDAKPDADAEQRPQSSVTHGLLVLLQDSQTQKLVIQRVWFAPLRPGRYINAQVGYNLNDQRIEIEFAARDAAFIPADGVKVRAHFEQPLAANATRQLEGLLRGPRYAVSLFAEVPADSPDMLLYLDIDDYPRALIFRVPCSLASSNLPPVTDMLDIRLLSPQETVFLKAPAEGIPVQYRVDAPYGAFQRDNESITFGVDIDRDREFREDPVVEAASDRQVDVAVASWSAGGRIKFSTKVSDFQLELPGAGLENTRVQVLGRVMAGGKVAWSNAAPVVLDGAPPEIEKIALAPPRGVEAGKDLVAVVWVSDGDLSGVAEVQVGFDTEGAGKFSPEAAPVSAVRQPDSGGRWLATLPTKALAVGPSAVLVQATDRVGNKSKFASVKFRVLPAVGDPSSLANDIVGEVKCFSQVVPRAEVWVETPAGEILKRTRADDQGRFKLSSIPVGKYVLRAKGKFRNELRREVEPLPVRVNAPPKPATKAVIQVDS